MKRKLMLGNKIKVFSNFVVTFLVVFLVLATVLLGCSCRTPPLGIPIEVDLSISNAPALNETAELTCTIASVFDAPNTTAQITLPDGFELVSGDLSWQGDIAPNGQESFNFSIRTVETGNWTIEADAGYFPDENSWYGDTDRLYVSVSEETAWVSKTPFLSDDTGARRLETPSVPIEVDLSISNAPALSETAELTCTIASVFGAPNTTAQITLPDGFELVSGDLSWQGDIAPNGQESFNLSIRTVKTGNWTIEADAGYFPDENSWYGDTDRLYVSVSEETAWVSEAPLVKEPSVFAERLDPAEIPNMAELPPQGIVPLLPEVPLEAGSPSSLSTLKITGKTWCYVSEDALPSPGQKRSDVMVPAVWGLVRVWDGDDNLIGQDVTGPKEGISEGRFEISVENPGSTGFYVGWAPWTGAARVCKQDGSDYWCYTSTFYPDPSDTSYDIGGWCIPDNSDYKGAWRVYETIVNDHYDRGAWDFLVNEGAGWTPPEITSRFPSDGTYYNILSHEIHIKTENYTKALDIVQHEYAHAVMHKVYHYYWPITHCPSPHYINRYSHPNCAWTEGWADSFPLMVQSYGRWEDPVFEWGTGSQRDLEIPTWGTPNWDDGEGVEGRVAGSLWDIFDSTDDGYDTFTDGFLNIWDVVYAQIDNNFAAYWDAWKARGHNIPKANAAIYQNTIDYSATLHGLVSFQGRGTPPSDRWIEPFEVKLFEPGNLDNVLWEGTATTNETGVFTITVFTPGTYDIGIKNWTCLSELETGVVFSGGEVTEVDFGTTREGDASNDDYVDGSDLALLSGAWYSYPGQPNWNANCDFNRDNYIDGSDLSLLSGNWLQWGDLFGV
jgi:hypothetical protein